jgi:hypothetical protein
VNPDERDRIIYLIALNFQTLGGISLKFGDKNLIECFSLATHKLKQYSEFLAQIWGKGPETVIYYWSLEFRA